MKDLLSNTANRLWQSLTVHPILLVIFPILFLYTQNLGQTSFYQAFSPLLVIFPVVLILWLLFYLWMRNNYKAALATSLFIVFFFSYGRVYTELGNMGIFVPSNARLFSFLLLLLGYTVYFIKRMARDFRRITLLLNAVAVVLILVNVFSLVLYQIQKLSLSQSSLLQKAGLQSSQTRSGQIANQPDIYLIILDEYANSDTMKDYYGYDNSQFLNSLKSRGFFIAQDSKMHNNETVRAVASILNMEHTAETEPEWVTYQRIYDNEVVKFLKNQGYQFIYFGNSYDLYRYELPADVHFNYYDEIRKSNFVNEYATVFWNTTALSPFYNYLFKTQFSGYYQEGTLNTLTELKKTPDMPGPKFVFAHILSPHVPFVFGPDGERVALGNEYNMDDKQYYLGQYIFISKEINKVIDEILKKSTVDPIIILQSDHGPRWTNEWEKVLNAYHLPGDGRFLLCNDTTPVNSFRIIFNYYFHADYALWEND